MVDVAERGGQAETDDGKEEALRACRGVWGGGASCSLGSSL